jgi:MFS family permease
MHLFRVFWAHRDFRLLMVGTVLTNLTMPAQFISMTFWAVDAYPGQKVLVSSLIVAVRGVGMLGSSLVGGAIADRFERRKVLLCCEAASAALTALLAFCMIVMPFGDATIVAVLAVVFLAAANMAIDGPSRSASIPAVVRPDEMGSAIGLNNIAQQMTFPIILPFVGFLNGTIGPGKVVAASLLTWVLILPIIASLRYSSRHLARRTSDAGFVSDIREGLRYTRRDATIFAAIGMIVVMQVVGMPGVGMLGPVWMTDVLGLSRAEFGWIAMLWGLGALVSSVVFAMLSRAPRRGLSLVAMVVLFGVCGIVFGHSRIVWLTAAANFGLGFAMTGALVTAITITQYTVAEEMRGRVMGLFPLVMGFSMLSVGPVGVGGQRLGLELVVPTLEWAALGLAVFITLVAPGLRRVRPAVAMPGPQPHGQPAAAPGPSRSGP